MAGAENLELSKREMLLACKRCDDKSDLSALCRICLTYLHPSEMTQIFPSSATDSWKALIESVTNVEVNAGDRLPALVCSLCVSKLNHTKEFKEKCISSENLLRNSLFKNDHLSADLDAALPRLSKHEGVTDTSDLCRLCVGSFAPYDTTPIFQDSGPYSLPDKIASVTSVKVAVGDGLPARICDCCVAKLRRASEFVEDAGAKDLYLRTELFQVKREVCDLQVPNDPLEPDWKPQVKQEPDAATKVTPTGNTQSPLLKPVVSTPVVLKPVVSKPVVSKPVVSKPVVSKPVVSKPVVSKPVVSKPVVSKPVVSKPVVSKPVMSKPVMSKPVMSKPVSGLSRGESGASESNEPRAGSKFVVTRTFQCVHCLVEFVTLNAFEDHLPCTIKPRPAKIARSVANATKCGGIVTKYLPCQFCDTKFSNRHTMYTHLRKFHAMQNQPFKCSQCPVAFFCQASLDDHEMSTHREESFQCDICKETFSNKLLFARHSATHSEFKSNVEKTVQCDFCEEKFTDKATRSLHMRVHSDVKPFKCLLCDKRFKNMPLWRVHQISHSNERPYKCEICDRSFKTKVVRRIHMVRHGNEMPFACKICDRRFKQQSSVSSHMAVHSDARPHACDQCDKTYKSRICLTQHLRNHADEPVTCAECGKVLSSERSYRGHLQTHAADRVKQFRCHVCAKSFLGKTGLVKHLATHEKRSKLFKCERCPRGFYLKGHLKTHFNCVHLKEKKHKCGVCDQAFFRKFGLMKHIASHTAV